VSQISLSEEGTRNEFNLNPQSSQRGNKKFDRKDQGRNQKACRGKGQTDAFEGTQKANATLIDHFVKITVLFENRTPNKEQADAYCQPVECGIALYPYNYIASEEARCQTFPLFTETSEVR
jgi:hypothetical protein